MQIIHKKIKELKEYGKNPRVNDKAAEYVAESITKFGFRNPIIIDKENMIVAGHTRLKAAKILKLDTVPCVLADDLTDEQIRRFRIIDNKSSEIADWDMELLEIEISELTTDDFNFSDFGFTEGQIHIEPLEDEVPQMSEEPISKYGQVYQLGRHRLMCGDSTLKIDIDILMNGVVADMVITDPPYNVNYEGKTKDKLKIDNDKMEDSPFREFLKFAFENINSVLKHGGVFYIWHASSEAYNFYGACKGVGWNIRQCLIWLKSSIVLGRQDYHWKHEPCLYGWKDGAGHLWNNNRKQSTILEFDRPNANKEHPTMKPVALFSYQISNNTNKGDTVLDVFGGSGTTLIACEGIGRTAYVMELDPKYIDVIIKRFENLTGEKAVLIR